MFDGPSRLMPPVVEKTRGVKILNSTSVSREAVKSQIFVVSDGGYHECKLHVHG